MENEMESLDLVVLVKPLISPMIPSGTKGIIVQQKTTSVFQVHFFNDLTDECWEVEVEASLISLIEKGPTVEFPHLSSYFTDGELEKIKSQLLGGQEHPLQWLLNPVDRRIGEIRSNTERAMSHIKKFAPHWIDQIKERLTDTSDYSNASSALAEVRCLGYLFEGAFEVEGKKASSASSDFFVNMDGRRTRVEVFAKHINKVEAAKLTRFNSDPKSEAFFSTKDVFDNGMALETHAISIAPFGKPAEGESITENAIQKIAQIKQNEKQFSETETCLVWCDFQLQEWTLHDFRESVFSLRSFRNLFSGRVAFTSGELWYALYGWRGVTVLAAPSRDFLTRISLSSVATDPGGVLRGG